MTLSTPERALLEILDELPERETFHQVDKLVEGLTNLESAPPAKAPGGLSQREGQAALLLFCRPPRSSLAEEAGPYVRIDLGKGKRMLVRGGKLDPTYEITVPEDLDAIS